MKKIITAAAWCMTAALLLCGCDSFFEDDSQQPDSFSAQSKTKETDFSGRGYACLTDPDEREAYALIDTAVEKTEPEQFKIAGGSAFDNFGDILEFYKNDHPQVFWLKDDVPYSYVDSGDTVTIELKYKLTGEKLTAAREALDKKLIAAVSGAPQSGSDYEKELYINDYLVDNCEYDDSAAELHKDNKIRGHEQDAFGALVEGTAVCEGYTRAFQLMGNKLGLTCDVIEGYANEKDEDTGKEERTPHIWNCICLDNEWYHTDVTWNDDVHGLFENVGSRKYYYLNLTTEAIKTDHEISPLFGEPKGDNDYCNAFVPSCTAVEYNYFHLNCPTLTSLDDYDNIVTSLTEAAANKDSYFDFLIDPSLDFGDTKSKISEGEGFKWIEDANEVNDDDAQLSTDCSLYAFEDRRLITFLLKYNNE